MAWYQDRKVQVGGGVGAVAAIALGIWGFSGGSAAKVEALCGPKPAALADASSGVARGSLHMQGLAIDIAIEGVPTATLRDAALSLARGGVGFYPNPGFVHVDVGRVRRW